MLSSSGKCQIIHWRQGHKDDCQPAIGDKEGECAVETSKNQFKMHLNNESTTYSDRSQELDDSGSSGSSASCFFSSTERSETSLDSSTSEAVELGTPVGPDKVSAVKIKYHMSQTISDSDDAHGPSPSRHVYSVDHRPRGNKIENTQAAKTDESIKSSGFKDKREEDGVAVYEKFVHGAVELRSSQSCTSARASSAEDWKNLAQMSDSKVTRSMSFRASDNNQMPNVELSSGCSKSLKIASFNERWENESKFFNSKETRSMTASKSSRNYQKLPIRTDSHAISSETEDASNLTQSTSKGLKTSVRRFVQHFKAPKQSKSNTFDMVKDSGGNDNHKVPFLIIFS